MNITFFPILLLAHVQSAVPPDSTILIARDSMIRLYTDCTEARMPGSIEELFVPKTTEEIETGVVRRRALEEAWRAYFAARAGDSIAAMPLDEWAYPLAARGRLLDNYSNPRADGPHGALDIFVTEGTNVRSPVAGVVVAAGDGWRGGYTRRRGFYYEGDGLSRRAGNGLILFDPASGGYFLMAHFRRGVRVLAGDIVRRGQPLGTVGRTGNASYPGRGKHLHIAFKRPGTACGIDGVLVSENPYRQIRAARARRGGRR
ncbi:MAG: M23 family metallopeptidase [Gemmatimonadales bacterium]|nr:M23 family metallopeptidase [Gemmatimonadales bacterium]